MEKKNLDAKCIIVGKFKVKIKIKKNVDDSPSPLLSDFEETNYN